jgi:hypothetical protein
MLYQMLYRKIGPSSTDYSQFRQRPRKDGLTKLTGTNTQAQTQRTLKRWLMVASPDVLGFANRGHLGFELGGSESRSSGYRHYAGVPAIRDAGRISLRGSRCDPWTTPGLWLPWQSISPTTTARSGSQRR